MRSFSCPIPRPAATLGQVNALSDPQLLRAYAERRSEAAFAELVRRHIDFVHSAALRMVNDAHLAKDVSQGVFVALAKDAGKLTDHPLLAGWLHRTARNIAAQTIRTDMRRRHREHEAAAMHQHSETDASWEEIAPQLDAALSELAEPDRDAVLLRYFENKPAREMATILGISAEAAQKRVSRAVEKLRENFAKRGVTAGAAGLAGVISTNAVQAAPIGLAATFSASALSGATFSASTAIAVTKHIAMTTLQKTLIAIAVCASFGIAAYHTNRATQLQAQNRNLQLTNARLTSEIVDLRGDLQTDATTSRTRNLSDDRNARKLARMAQEKTEEMREAGMLAKKNAPNYLLIGEDGRITQQAMREAGITPTEADAIQRIFDDKWKEVSKRLSANVRLDESASDPERGMFAYNIPALPDGGSDYITQIENEIKKIAGATPGRILIDAFSPNSYLCGFGKYDVRVELYLHGENGRNNSPTAKYWFTYPKTSQVVRGGNVSQERFHEHFGFVLDNLPSKE